MFDFIRGRRPVVYLVWTGVILTVIFAAVWVYGELGRGEGVDMYGVLMSPVLGFGAASTLFISHYFGVWFSGGDGGDDGGGFDVGG